MTYCSHVCILIFDPAGWSWLTCQSYTVHYIKIWYFQRRARAKLKFPCILPGFLSQALCFGRLEICVFYCFFEKPLILFYPIRI